MNIIELAKTKRNVQAYINVVFEPDDIVEIRYVPSGLSEFYTPTEIMDYIKEIHQKNQSGQNVYVGVNPRKAVGGKADVDVGMARCLFADLDHGATVESVTALLKEKDVLEPTLMLESGHGVHLYWKLDEPITDMVKWRIYQKRLIATLGSDPVICNPSRIMRLPGFINQKEDDGVESKIISIKEYEDEGQNL